MQDDLYAPYLGQLSKLAFLASAIHQTVFTLLSTLPFAVGQVSRSALATCVSLGCQLYWEGLLPAARCGRCFSSVSAGYLGAMTE
jgi:SulP family sulfate permease